MCCLTPSLGQGQGVDLGCNGCTWMGSDQVDPTVGFVEGKHIFYIACGLKCLKLSGRSVRWLRVALVLAHCDHFLS
jgi:hypothetical protein